MKGLDFKLENVLFLDIETVPAAKTYADFSPAMVSLWNHKAEWIAPKEATPGEKYERAGIYAEFGRIVCISVGYFSGMTPPVLRIKSFSGHQEAAILKEFADLVGKYFSQEQSCLCAHNWKEFDFPYISRRMVINQIPLPEKLNLHGMKKWEVMHLDTMELWRFGDYKNFTSLELLAEILNIPSPKGDITGKDVGRTYWEENDLERIVNYCQKDVITIAQIMRRYRYEPLIPDESIVIIS